MILTLMLLIVVGGVTFTILQTSVAPAVQQQTEARHYTVVRGDFQTLRNNLFASATQGTQTATLITLGSNYPSYLLLAQPPGPFGRVQTTGPRRVTLSNVNATDPDVKDLLKAPGVDGDGKPTTITLRPQGVKYTPQYHQFPAPTIYTWPTGVVAAKLSNGSRLIAGQSLVAGRRLTLVNVTGSIARGQAAPLSMQTVPESASVQTITLTEAKNAPVNLTVPTALPKQQALDLWKKLLQGQIDDSTDGGDLNRLKATDCEQSKPVDTEFVCYIGFNDGGTADTVTDNQVVISLEYMPGSGSNNRISYRLSAALVGLKTRSQPAPAVTTTPRYLVTESFEEPTVPEGSKLPLTVELRDQYHNPVGQRPVYAEVTKWRGTITRNTKLTNQDGQATVIYEAPQVHGNTSEKTAEVTVWLGSTRPPSPKPREKVTFNITVQNTG